MNEWERSLIEKLATAATREQTRNRRWGIFFKFLMFAYFTLLLLVYLPDDLTSTDLKSEDHTAVVDIDGVIAADAEASADHIVAGLRAAFKDKHTKGVILRANSPGGSPVQSSYVNNEIVRLREKHPDIPVYAVIADICASGCYYIVSAADKIYANESSLVGSIGVLMQTFGVSQLMEKVGVQQRLYTAGEHKGFLDPFSPEKEFDVEFAKNLLDELHEEFISVVKTGRGERLKTETPNLFSGLVWSGRESLDIGLIDGFGSTSDIARDVIGEEETKVFKHEDDLIDRFAKKLGMGMAEVFGSLPDAIAPSFR